MDSSVIKRRKQALDIPSGLNNSSLRRVATGASVSAISRLLLARERKLSTFASEISARACSGSGVKSQLELNVMRLGYFVRTHKVVGVPHPLVVAAFYAYRLYWVFLSPEGGYCLTIQCKDFSFGQYSGRGFGFYFVYPLLKFFGC